MTDNFFTADLPEFNPSRHPDTPAPHRPPARPILELPLNIDPTVLAVVFDPETGEEYDQIGVYSWETAIQYSHDGYIVVVYNPPKHHGDLTVQDFQAACNYEQLLVQDCFGRSAPNLAFAS